MKNLNPIHGLEKAKLNREFPSIEKQLDETDLAYFVHLKTNKHIDLLEVSDAGDGNSFKSPSGSFQGEIKGDCYKIKVVFNRKMVRSDHEQEEIVLFKKL